MKIDPTRLLMLYSGVLTAAFVVVATTAASAPPRPANARFDTIDVKRINVREDDGTLRMIVSNSSRAPGIIVKSIPTCL